MNTNEDDMADGPGSNYCSGCKAKIVDSNDGREMNEDYALLAMALVARRANIWIHDIMASRPISDGYLSADAVGRFKADIMEALAILDRPDAPKSSSDPIPGRNANKTGYQWATQREQTEKVQKGLDRHGS